MIWMWRRKNNSLREARRPEQTPRRKRWTARLWLERLEDRVAPAVAQPDFVFAAASPASAASDGSAPASGTYTPAQIRTAYGFNNLDFGPSTPADGSGQTIAIVDAYNDPTILTDVDVFDKQFTYSVLSTDTLYQKYGAASSFLTVYSMSIVNNVPTATAIDPTNTTVPADPGDNTISPPRPPGNWEIEESLDVEWAHAIAPAAKIDLVEANNAGLSLFLGAEAAAALPGVSAVSMSWSDSEADLSKVLTSININPPNETALDGLFTTPAGHSGVTFLAATGDYGSPGYPAFSPNVIAVGGTTLNLTGDGTPTGETGWGNGSDTSTKGGSGGGTSIIEPVPYFQSSLNGTNREVPDVSMEADPKTGVPIYDSYDNPASKGGWESTAIGGTSLATPMWAGLVAIVDQGISLADPTATYGVDLTAINYIYQAYKNQPGDFNDITSGNNGNYSAGPGYDEVTGLGTPVANLLVPDLVCAPICNGLAAQNKTLQILNDAQNHAFYFLDDAGNLSYYQNGDGPNVLAGPQALDPESAPSGIEQIALDPGANAVYYLNIIGYHTFAEQNILGTIGPNQQAAPVNGAPGDIKQIAYDPGTGDLVYLEANGNVGTLHNGNFQTVLGPAVEDFAGNPGPFITKFGIDASSGQAYAVTSDNQLVEFTPVQGLSLGDTSATYDSITAQPSDETALVGLTASFTAASAFASDQVQWYVSSDGGATFTPLSDTTGNGGSTAGGGSFVAGSAPSGLVYSGTGSNTLTISGLTDSLDGYQYKAEFFNPLLGDSSAAVSTRAATLHVNPGVFYVNDGSTAGDVLTAAPGSPINDGLTPDTPLASVQEVLDTYTMQPGFTINIDTGTYMDGFTLNAGDAGVAITGVDTQLAVIDGAVLVQGADGVQISGLSLAGGVTLSDDGSQPGSSDFFSVDAYGDSAEVNFGSDTPSTNDSTLSGIVGALTIVGGSGNANRLVVTDASDPSAEETIQVASSAVDISGGAISTVNYGTAAGGSFDDGRTNDGVLIQGPAQGATFNILSTLAGSTTEIQGGVGDDIYNVTNAGLTAGIAGVLFINDQGGGSNSLIVDNSAGTVDQTVTVTASSITGISPAEIDYATSGSFTDPNSQADDGILINGANFVGVSGSTFDIQGTLSGSTTEIDGGTGNDLYNVTNAGLTSGIGGVLFINDQGGGGNRLIVDNSAGTADQALIVTASSILGIAPGTIDYASSGDFTDGQDNDGILIKGANGAGVSGSTFDVQGSLSGSTTEIDGGAGSDVYNVTDAGQTAAIAGVLFINDQGGSANRLVIDNSAGSADQIVTLTANSISGIAPAAIDYTSTGNFTDPLLPTDDGVFVFAGTGSTIVNVQSTRAGSNTEIDGGTGPAYVFVSSSANVSAVPFSLPTGVLDDIAGNLTIVGGSSLANRLVVSDLGQTAVAKNDVVLTTITLGGNTFGQIQNFTGTGAVIDYTATGSFDDVSQGVEQGDGVLLVGSNTLPSTFNIRGHHRLGHGRHRLRGHGLFEYRPRGRQRFVHGRGY